MHLHLNGVVDAGATLADGSGIGSPNAPAQVAALAWCAAWFAIDLVNDVVVLGDRSVAMVAHHMLGSGVCIVPLLVAHGGCEVLVCTCLAECSTPFFSLALVYKGTSLETPLWAVFAALFVYIRGHYATKMLYFVNVSDTHWGTKLGASALVLLSYVWIVLILKKVAKKAGILQGAREGLEGKKRA